MNQTNDTAIAALESLWHASRGTNAWLNERQQDALASFRANGFPTTALEDWKYTDIRDVASNYPHWLATPASPTKNLPAELPVEAAAARIIFVDGYFRPELSSDAALPDGLYIGPLAEITNQQPELQARLGTLAADADSGLVALNTAFTADVFVMRLAANREIDRPICVHFHTTTPEKSVQPRLLIDLGANSRATLLERYTSAGPAIVNSVTEIFIGPGARLTRDKLQQEDTDAWHTALQCAHLEADATLLNTQIDIGAGLARNDLRVTLGGRGAHLEARGLFMADGNRHIDSRITVEHAAPDTTSKERYRSILADKARGVFNGRILVRQQAQKTAADLTNKNLLLSPGAEIDTKPELEIYADDVRCAHGSTTGQLDKNALFYLLSRGIEQNEARGLLIRAFAAGLLTDISVPGLADIVQDALHSLGQGS